MLIPSFYTLANSFTLAIIFHFMPFTRCFYQSSILTVHSRLCYFSIIDIYMGLDNETEALADSVEGYMHIFTDLTFHQ